MGRCCTKKSAPARYIEERKKWEEAGEPIRPDGEMTRIFMEECSPCKYFKRIVGQRGKCKVCGCSLHPISKTMNKLAWATTSCPLPEPKWKSWNTAES